MILSNEELKNKSIIKIIKELSSRILLDKILDKSESIGRWREFLDKLEDWSNPHVTIAQNHIRDFKKQREEMIREFYNYFDWVVLIKFYLFEVSKKAIIKLF